MSKKQLLIPVLTIILTLPTISHAGFLSGIAKLFSKGADNAAQGSKNASDDIFNQGSRYTDDVGEQPHVKTDEAATPQDELGGTKIVNKLGEEAAQTTLEECYKNCGNSEDDNAPNKSLNSDAEKRRAR